MNKPKYRFKKWLEEEYKTKSIGEIARNCNVDKRCISQWIDKHGIKKRSHKENIELHLKKKEKYRITPRSKYKPVKVRFKNSLGKEIKLHAIKIIKEPERIDFKQTHKEKSDEFIDLTNKKCEHKNISFFEDPDDYRSYCLDCNNFVKEVVEYEKIGGYTKDIYEDSLILSFFILSMYPSFLLSRYLLLDVIGIINIGFIDFIVGIILFFGFSIIISLSLFLINSHIMKIILEYRTRKVRWEVIKEW